MNDLEENQMRKIIITTALTIALAAPTMAQDPAQHAEGVIKDCEKTMETDGFLTRAQFQCDIKYYSRAVRDAAQMCFHLLGEVEAGGNVARGMTEFDDSERNVGHAKICRQVLATFPEALRN
jgi:hypothetical protein